jgi:ABC-2 type transport system permease protein
VGSITRTITLAFRELRSYLQDKGDLAFSLLLPIAIFALIYGAFGGQTEFHGTANIVNEDKGIYSERFLSQLKVLDTIKVQLLSADTADTKLQSSDLLLVVYIPADFSSRISNGEPTQLIFRQRGNGGTEGQIVASILRGVAEQINQNIEIENRVEKLVTGKNIDPSYISETTQKFIFKEQQSPLIETTETTIGSSPDPVNQFLPGIITMFVLFSITLGAQGIVEERRKGTLERLLTTHLTRGELFAGKFASGVLRAFVQTLILLILSYIVFQLFTPVSFLEVLVLALVFSAAASALGLVIAAISRTPDQAIWISVFFTNVCVMLSGTFFTIPDKGVFHILSEFSINTYANKAFVGLITEGKSLAGLGSEIVIILSVAVVGLLLARFIFRAVPGGK